MSADPSRPDAGAGRRAEIAANLARVEERIAAATDFLRRAGVLRSLLDRGAIGLVTTHDLALTAVADELSSRAVNVHFEDRFEAGEILFDYTMKPGPVTGSANGSPNSGGYLLQAGFWPDQNVEVSILYQGFTTFNGASQNYDGAGRNAGQNNTVYTSLWLMF